jgi:peroxiredoxin
MISGAAGDDYKVQLAKSGLETVLFQQQREVSARFGVTASPSAVFIRSDGTIGSSLAQGAAAISDLLSRILAPSSGSDELLPAVAGRAHLTLASGRALSSEVPTFLLPNLEGEQIDTSAFRDRSHLFVFWDPSCGYCTRLLPELREWDQDRSEDAARIVVISTGAPERNRELGLRSPVLLDQNFEMRSVLGVRGTPSALLIDVDGRPLAPMAVGAPQIGELVAFTMRNSRAESESIAIAT